MPGKRGDASNLRYGREVWQCLEKIAYSRSRDQVFEDWLDLMLNADLSLSDNFGRPGFVEKLQQNKLTGLYEDRYMAIVQRYDAEDVRSFGEAYGHLLREVAEHQVDVLGEIYMACISFGQHGQFFTPESITGVMAEIIMGDIQPGQSVLDPCCGSGRFLIEAGRKCPEAFLTGVDLDPRCAKMSALNMLLFDFNADILWGNSLAMTYDRQWSIRRGGFIVERGVEPEIAKAVKKATGQQTLLAA